MQRTTAAAGVEEEKKEPSKKHKPPQDELRQKNIEAADTVDLAAYGVPC